MPATTEWTSHLVTVSSIMDILELKIENGKLKVLF